MIKLLFMLVLISSAVYARNIDTIVIHTTATDMSITDIDKYHKSLGWDGCGYHYIIDGDCIIHQCRDFEQTGAHVKGFNQTSLGVAWHGSSDKPPVKQYECLKTFVYALTIIFNIDKIKGHNVYPTAKEQGKTCPNMDMDKFRKDLRTLTNGGHTL